MEKIAILDLKQFDRSERPDFYANIVSQHLMQNHHAISVPHKHNFYVTVLFTQGEGFHEVDFERFEVVRGSIFFLNPGQTHYWELSDDIEGYIFFHSESFYSLNFSQNTLAAYPFFYSTQNSPYMLLSEAVTGETAKRMSTILEEYISDQPWKFRKINNLVDGLYIDLARIYIAGGQEKIHHVSHYSEKVKQLELLIDQFYRVEKSPAAYAEKMNMSAKHLNRIVQQSVGKTTTQLITERMMLEAKRLLSHSGLSLAEIAEFLGYDEYAYFSRLFRKHALQTPSEFRASYAGNE